MLPLKADQQLKVRHPGKEAFVPATLTGIREGELTLYLEDAAPFERGDELELEIPQEKDAPYPLSARVREVGTGSISTLKLMGKLSPMERRRYSRLPTNVRARYFLRPKQPGEPECLQGEIQDISRGGALLTTEEPLGEPLTFEREIMFVFELPMGRKESFTTGIDGRVVWEQHKGIPEKHSYGAEFSRNLALSG